MTGKDVCLPSKCTQTWACVKITQSPMFPASFIQRLSSTSRTAIFPDPTLTL